MLFHEEWQLEGGRAKLANNNAIELYNLRDDLSERNNLANTQTAMRDAMIVELLAWLEQIEAPIPTQANAAFDHKKPFKSKKKKLPDE